MHSTARPVRPTFFFICPRTLSGFSNKWRSFIFKSPVSVYADPINPEHTLESSWCKNKNQSIIEIQHSLRHETFTNFHVDLICKYVKWNERAVANGSLDS